MLSLLFSNSQDSFLTTGKISKRAEESGDGDGGPFTNKLWDDSTTWDDSGTFAD